MVFGVGESQDDEVAVNARVGSGGERQHLESHVGLPARLGDGGELRSDHCCAAHRPVQRCLVKHDMEFRRIVPAQDGALPGGACHHPPLDLVGAEPRPCRCDDGVGVIGRLEYAWHDVSADLDLRCLGFQAHVGPGEHVLVARPPAAAPGVPAETDERVAVGGADVVKVEHVFEVVGVDAGLAVLDPVELALAEVESPCCLVGGHAGRVAEPLQFPHQAPAADRRTVIHSRTRQVCR